MRIPDCAYCGKPLKGTRHIRVAFEDGIGVPMIGWHGEKCMEADEESYDLAMECQSPVINMDGPPDDWIPEVVREILGRGKSRVSAGARLWRVLKSKLHE